MQVILVLALFAALAGVFYPYIKGFRRWHFGLAAFAIFIMIGAVAPAVEKEAATNTAVKTDTKPSSGTPTEKQPVVEKTTTEKAVEQMEREIASMKKGTSPALADHKDIMIQMVVIGARAQILADNTGPFTAEQRKTVDKFKSASANWQTKMFPKMRLAQAKIYNKALWEQNLEVSAYGSASKNIRFVGGMLASNAIKKQFHEQAMETLQLLRFNRDTYEWYRGSEGTYWDIGGLTDRTLAKLDGNGWVKIEDQ